MIAELIILISDCSSFVILLVKCEQKLTDIKFIFSATESETICLRRIVYAFVLCIAF